MSEPQTNDAPKHDPTYDLDLDTLVKPSKKVRINGEIVEIQPPSLEELVGLAKLGGELQSMQVDKKNMDVDQVETAITKLRDGFASLVPELKDHKLNIDQLLALLDLVVQTAQPNDVKELEKRGISMSDDQKKTVSGS